MQGEETPLKGELKVNTAAEMGSDSQQKGKKAGKQNAEKQFFFFFLKSKSSPLLFPGRFKNLSTS